MARKLEQIIAEMLGGYAVQVAQLSARVEALTEENAALKQQIAERDTKPRMALVPETEKVS